MSPSAAIRRPRRNRRRAQQVDSGAHRGRIGVVALVDQQALAAESARSSQSVSRAPRPCAGATRRARQRWTRSRGRPRAASSTPSALIARCFPGAPMVNGNSSPSRARRRARRFPAGRRSAGARPPPCFAEAQHMRRVRILRRRSSSEKVSMSRLTMATPPSTIPEKISALARAIASTFSKCSRWTGATRRRRRHMRPAPSRAFRKCRGDHARQGGDFSGSSKGGVAIVNRHRHFPAARSGGQGLARGLCPELGRARRRRPSDEIRSGGRASRASPRGCWAGRAFQPRRAGRHMAINALGVLLAARAVGHDFASIAASLVDALACAGRAPAKTLGSTAPIPRASACSSTRATTPIRPRCAPLSTFWARRHFGAGAADRGARRHAGAGPSGPALHAALNDDLQRNRIDLVSPPVRVAASFDALRRKARAGRKPPWRWSPCRRGPARRRHRHGQGLQRPKLHALTAGLKNRYPRPETQKIED